MAIDEERFMLVARRGDVSGIAIKCTIAFGAIADSLDAIRQGKPIDEADILKIKKTADEIEKIFDMLTGWTPDD